MSRLPAVMRRLDPWAALLLGILVALGVIILLATPGPWHKVVPARPHVGVAPTPPNDVAVFVHAGSVESRCTGVVWVHLRYDPPAVTAVVVPTWTMARLGGAGFEPLASIVDDAGPEAGAAGLAEVTGVSMQAWVSLGRQAVRDAFPDFIEAQTSRWGRPQLKAIAESWNGRADPHLAARLQVEFLKQAIAGWHRSDMNLVAFANYLLGSPDALTSMKLQQASAIAAALGDTPRRRVFVSGLPSLVWERGRYERWLPQADALLALRRAFALDALPPVLPPSVERRPAGDHVLVLTGPDERLASAYGAALDRALRSSAGRPIRIEVRTCASINDVGAALRERPGATPPLAAVVALGRSRSGLLSPAAARGLVAEAAAGLRAHTLPGLISQVPGGGEQTAAVNEAIGAVAGESGLPLSVVMSASRSAAGSGAESAAVPAGRWARANAELLVRCVEPGFFAPRLASTRLGVSYYGRRALGVGVVAADPERAAVLLSRLGNLGYKATVADWSPASPLPSTAIYFREGDRKLALCLAGDTGVSRRRVRLDDDAPSAVMYMQAF